MLLLRRSPPSDSRARDDPERSQRPCPNPAVVQEVELKLARSPTMRDAQCSLPDRQRGTYACPLLRVLQLDPQPASAAAAAISQAVAER